MTRNSRIAVISGASTGLGKELAPLISAQGYEVVKLGLSSPGEVDYRVDLTDFQETQDMVLEIQKNRGEVSLLILNAGGGKRPSFDRDADDFHEYFMKRNYHTAKNLLESSISSLRAAKGSVIAISSIVAVKEIKLAPAGYVRAKLRLNNYIMEAARQNAKDCVRANIISPGNVLFPGSRWDELQRLEPERVSTLLRDEVPLGRFITPKEIAEAIRYLASSEACNITGANLIIDGGQSL